MILKRKNLILFVIIQTLLFLTPLTVRGEASAQPDESQILGFLTNGRPLAKKHKNCIVPFEYFNDKIFVKVKINNQKQDYRFLLDTGAGTTVINPRVTAGLNLSKVAEINVDDGYLSQNAAIVVIDKLTLGEISVGSCGATVFDMEKIEDALNLKIDGILGSNFLSFFVVRIDYSKKELVFTANRDGFDDEIEKSHRIPLVKEATGLVFAPLTIAGVDTPFKAEIDTGATSGLLIPMHYLEQFKPVLNSRIVRCLGAFHGGAFSESDGSISRIGQFKLGDLAFENMVVDFENRENDFLILGNDFLSRFILIINYPRNELFLLPLKNKTLETNLRIFGFNVKQDQMGEIKITSLYEGSMAEQAGLRVGDVILRVAAEGESGTSDDEFKTISEKYDTIHLFMQRDNGEEEIVLKKDWLFPEVE